MKYQTKVHSLVPNVIVEFRLKSEGEKMTIELKRIEGTCCPEPSCDNIRNPEECKACGAICAKCKGEA